ncbi:MAG: aminotransferase class III-fold pyridoxal phosphate-dependent enzyme, partial [Candidatus Promineifilaceae bacterium]|nr:aminotransferase class III-fold pyridoxal phosphate-dependent enzyme [Candidatus Promineifilaceae bacterium]
IKVVRKWGYETKSVEKDRAEIIVCEGNFHGRTTTIVGFSSKEKYREGFGPFTPGFVHIPYGDARALEAAITPNTVGFLVEPVQGEGGVCVPPVGYLKRAAEICQAHDVLLMADEIQTGLGRTGRLFASEHEGVRPDVMILGKALSGGFYPVSAVLADEPVLGLLEPGHHGSTFGGNPLGAAIAREALRVLVEEDLVSRAALLGDYLLQCLREIDSPHVKEVRGKGLLIGVELDKAARPFAETLRDWGVLVKETQGTVLRIAPPLVIEKEEVDWALERIARVLTMR